jgi:hypothetical protein
MQARQKSIKDRLLQQVPVIGRERLKNRSMDQVQLSAAPNGFTGSGASAGQLGIPGVAGHSRSNSRGEMLGVAGQQQ